MPAQTPTAPHGAGRANAASVGEPAAKLARGFGPRAWVIGGLVLLAYLALCATLPLGKAIKIGADEDFELSKAVLCLKGYNLYSDIWSDQPPLYAFLLTQIVKHISPSIAAVRLLTTAFTLLLLASVWLLASRSPIRTISAFRPDSPAHPDSAFGLQRGGQPDASPTLALAALATAMVIMSPGFIELSCSCMQEIPALAPIVASLCLLMTGRPAKWRLTELLAGLLFAVGLQIKYIGIAYLPLVILAEWLRSRHDPAPSKSTALGLLVFTASVALASLGINALTGAPLLLQFHQGWAAHFAAGKSFEYGSAADHPFDWSVLLRNWDVTVPAVIGVLFLLRVLRVSVVNAGARSPNSEGRSTKEVRKPNSENQIPSCASRVTDHPAGFLFGLRSSGFLRTSDFEFRTSLFLLSWTALTLLVFGLHKPWWQSPAPFAAMDGPVTQAQKAPHGQPFPDPNMPVLCQKSAPAVVSTLRRPVLSGLAHLQK